MNSIDICNLALGMLGMPRITSFEETNNNARLCADFFPVLRDRLLREHFWSFAVTTAVLPELQEISPYRDYAKVFSVPADSVRVVGISGDEEYIIAGNKIYTNCSPCTLVYVSSVEDPELFDSAFSGCLQYLLAAEIGAANTRDPNLVNYYMSQYQSMLSQAKAMDSQENVFASQFSAPHNPFLAARGGHTSRFKAVKPTKGTAGRA